MNEKLLYRCWRCEEWGVQPCAREGHDKHVEMPDPEVATMNMLERIVELLVELAHKE